MVDFVILCYGESEERLYFWVHIRLIQVLWNSHGLIEEYSRHMVDDITQDDRQNTYGAKGNFAESPGILAMSTATTKFCSITKKY